MSQTIHEFVDLLIYFIRQMRKLGGSLDKRDGDIACDRLRQLVENHDNELSAPQRQLLREVMNEELACPD